MKETVCNIEVKSPSELFPQGLLSVSVLAQSDVAITTQTYITRTGIACQSIELPQLRLDTTVK